MSQKRAYRATKNKDKIKSGKKEDATRSHSFKALIFVFTKEGQKQCELVKPISPEIKESRLEVRRKIQENFDPENPIEVTICGIAGNKTFTAELPDGRKLLVASREIRYSETIAKK